MGPTAQILSKHLLELAHAYARTRPGRRRGAQLAQDGAVPMKLTSLAVSVCGDGRLFSRIVRGELTVDRYDRTLAWFAENWPEDAEWPADIPRPENWRDGTWAPILSAATGPRTAAT